MALGCYVAYKEAKHHELHKLRAEFLGMEEMVKALKEKELENGNVDPEADEIFKGEILCYEKVIRVLSDEGADTDLIQEIENDLVKIKEKIAGLFKK